jgi:NAD(P)-dependent dehydrogenase (short-subunit alcohol dehydrogenase family)
MFKSPSPTALFLCLRPLFSFASKVDPFGGQYLKPPPPNPNRLKSKVAVITGGSAGVGQATALLFAKSGIEGLVLGDVNDAQATIEQIKEATKGTVQTLFVKTDLQKPDDIKNLMESAYKKFGKLNILVNNAGVMHGDDDNAMTTEEKVWDLTMNINLKGLFFCCKFGIPLIQKSNGGSIINVASFVG